MFIVSKGAVSHALQGEVERTFESRSEHFGTIPQKVPQTSSLLYSTATSFYWCSILALLIENIFCNNFALILLESKFPVKIPTI